MRIQITYVLALLSATELGANALPWFVPHDSIVARDPPVLFWPRGDMVAEAAATGTGTAVVAGATGTGTAVTQVAMATGTGTAAAGAGAAAPTAAAMMDMVKRGMGEAARKAQEMAMGM